VLVDNHIIELPQYLTRLEQLETLWYITVAIKTSSLWRTHYFY